MNRKIKSLLIAWGFLAFSIQVHSQGYIVPNGVTEYSFGGWPAFRVLQNPNSDYTAFYFIPQGGNNFVFNSFVDEGVRVFLVNANDPVSSQAIQANSYPELIQSGIYAIPNGADFYVGLYTGYNPWVIVNGSPVYTGIYTDPMFGWAELFNNNGTLQLVDGALAYGSQGIYAGTTTIIPEPGTLSVFGLGALLLGLRWHRKGFR